MRLILPILTLFFVGCSLSLSAQTPVDFTTMPDAQTYGDHAQIQINGVWAMWGGDVNGDGKVINNAASSDATEVANRVLSDPGNAGFFGSGPVSNYTGASSVYELYDVQLDGKIINNAADSDFTFISNNVLIHPDNLGFFGSGPVSNFTGLEEQLP